jgi:tetratricopeptide (TPR) repeat protein
VETRVLYAKALAQEGRLAKARKEDEAILARVPDHAFARLDLATVLHEQREYPLVLAHLEALPRGLKGSPWVQYLYARTLLEKGDLPQARRLAMEFLKRAPKNLRLLTLAGEIERASGDPKQAEVRYREAIGVAPRSWEPVSALVGLLQGQARFGEARAAVGEFQRRNGEKPDALNRLASLGMAQGDFEGALHSVERSLLLEPNYWASKFLRARILLAQGAESKAVVEFEEAIRLNPYRPDAYNHLAEVYRKKGDLARAEEAYRRLLEKSPDDPLTANNLASLCLEEGKTQEGLSLARRAYEAAPASPAVLDTLGWALHLSGDPRRAQPLLDGARRLLPREPEVLLHWGLNAQALQRSREAGAVLAEVVRLDPASKAAASAQRALGKTVPLLGGK